VGEKEKWTKKVNKEFTEEDKYSVMYRPESDKDFRLYLYDMVIDGEGNIVLSEPGGTMRYIMLQRNGSNIGSLSTANGRISLGAESGCDGEHPERDRIAAEACRYDPDAEWSEAAADRRHEIQHAEYRTERGDAEELDHEQRLEHEDRPDRQPEE